MGRLAQRQGGLASLLDGLPQLRSAEDGTSCSLETFEITMANLKPTGESSCRMTWRMESVMPLDVMWMG